MKKIKKIVIALILSILLILGMGFGYVYSKLNSIYEKEEIRDNQQQNEDAKIVEGITNILLVGTDGTNVDKGNRSDSMMLITIDSNTKDIKISSIPRDTYVNIPGYGHEKLTHAYAYEGISLLREVFKINFDLDIDKYIAVDYTAFMDVIDEIGGVEVNIEAKDIQELNKYIDHCYHYYTDEEKEKIEKVYIKEAGIQRLNGHQALAFSRIRYTDSAFHRESRHREVAESVYKEFLTKGPDEYKRAANIILEHTKTNIAPTEMMNLGFTVLKIADTDIEKFQFPLAQHSEYGIVDGAGWVIKWDKEPNLDAWNKFIFGE